jgi:allantoinase
MPIRLPIASAANSGSLRMSNFDLMVKGRLAIGDAVLDNGWMALRGEHIAAIGQGEAPAAQTCLDAGNDYVLPGVIDGQTHAGSQFGFAGLERTTLSAVAGGVTTIVDMPYDQPDPVATRAILRQKVEAANAVSHCDVALYGTVAADPVLADIEALAEDGVCAFKISSFENHPTRFPRIDNGAAMVLLQALASSNLPIGLHNEDEALIRRLTQKFISEGKTAPRFHHLSRPESAELLATANFLELGRLTGAHVHIVHISMPEGFRMVRRAVEQGVRATAEMCVHYLHFDAATDIDRLGALMKVNPPIRAGHLDELWRLYGEGDYSFVSSDHSAWPLERKQAASIFDVAAGVPGLETLLPTFFSDVAKRENADAAAIACAAYLSDKPARFFGLSRKGALAPGMDADFIILKPEAWQFDATKTQDGLGWSPYNGETFAAKPVATYVRGMQVWGDAARGKMGHGRFVARG